MHVNGCMRRLCMSEVTCHVELAKAEGVECKHQRALGTLKVRATPAQKSLVNVLQAEGCVHFVSCNVPMSSRARNASPLEPSLDESAVLLELQIDAGPRQLRQGFSREYNTFGTTAAALAFRRCRLHDLAVSALQPQKRGRAPTPVGMGLQRQLPIRLPHRSRGGAACNAEDAVGILHWHGLCSRVMKLERKV
mmetsp:Transcript_31092/g.62264  ORF Transcript_31092/g.62264 Transcript_31092/m.62264 type:complete len:193 (-) Transcript_31092:683-1261(-)